MTEMLSARSLGELVAEAPARARVLDRLGLDYCCHGDRSLAEASRAAGVDPATVVAALSAVLQAAPAAFYAGTDPLALIDEIVAHHHQYLWEELPALDALAAKVSDVHGSRHPELPAVHDLVVALRTDLEPHMMREERILFPAVRLLYRRLEHLEEDTHLHIHKENDVLFPMATALAAAGS
jgi:regulator of cell morphogenesis and NO signaling